MPGTSPFLLESPAWQDYALLDAGDGAKLERFGPYVFARPEPQAIWGRALPAKAWSQADAVFQPTGEESGGHWELQRTVAERWGMSYPLAATAAALRFWVRTTPGRHLGVFPEGAANWDWIAASVRSRNSTPDSTGADGAAQVLSLFGYTGIGTLAAAAAGASVTHVDASKKSVSWARENQALSGHADRPIRWIVEDALAYVQREARRGVRYDGIILDPPKFGRGPKGQVWELYQSLPALLKLCRACLSERPLFLIATVYAVRASAVHIAQALQECIPGGGGNMEYGELVTRDNAGGRLLSQAVFARWGSGTS